MARHRENTTTDGGPEAMKEVTINGATYLVCRHFAEERSVTDIIADRLVAERKDKTTFDEGHDDTV